MARSLVLLASLNTATAGFAQPRLGSFSSLSTPPVVRHAAAAEYAPRAASHRIPRSKFTEEGKACASESSQYSSVRNWIAPAVSYAGLGAVAAGSAKLVAVASPGSGMMALGAIATPALLLLMEFTLLGGGARVAQMMGGKRADSYVTEIADEVSAKAGMPPPAHVFEIPTSELNAFAAGFGSKDATVAITSGLREALSKKELEAVIAHEIGHIRHHDMSTNMHVAVAIAGLGGVYEAGRMLWRSNSDKKTKRDQNSDDDSSLASTGLILMAGGATMRILAHLAQLFVSRTAEYDADRVAAQLCGSEAMISALSKIEAAAKKRPAKTSSLRTGRAAAFAHACISSGEADVVEPDVAEEGGVRGKVWAGARRLWAGAMGLTSTHPSTKDRIAALRAHGTD